MTTESMLAGCSRRAGIGCKCRQVRFPKARPQAVITKTATYIPKEIDLQYKVS